MPICITSASRQLYHAIASFDGVGRIHSVYRKTINLCFHDTIAAIQCADTPFSPVSLLTALSEQEMRSLAVTPGMSVHIQKEADQLHIVVDGTYRFSLSRQITEDVSLSQVLTDTDIRLLLKNCQEALAMHSHDSFDTVLTQDHETCAHSLLLSVMHDKLSQISAAFHTCHYQEAASMLCQLTGLGTGLTPAGDDFLCGVLAACRLSSEIPRSFASALQQTLSDKLQSTPDCTNIISRTFLQCALNGLFSHAVLHLPTIPSKERIAADFSAIGHSSGYDTLSGIVFVLNQFLNNI